MKTLPEDFRTYTQALMGEKLYQRLEHAILEEEAPTSIRINPLNARMLMANRFPGVRKPDVISLRVPDSPSIRCCMPAYIMYRKPHPCLLIWLSDST